MAVLLEEYRALYGLLALRLSAVDQRVPLAGGVVLATLTGIVSLPPTSQVILLLATPTVLTWLARMTVAHVRSKEDVLRRIDELERHVNHLVGEELLAFQSRHPSRGDAIAGRTGTAAFSSVMAVCAAGLLGCVAIAVHQLHLPPRFIAVYVGYVAVGLLDLLLVSVQLRRYRYAKGPAPGAPLVRLVRWPRNSAP